MAHINRTFLAVVLLLFAIPLAQLAVGAIGGNVTVMQQATPAEARPGDIVLVTGYAPDANQVNGIYLTNGEIDYRLEIVEQDAAAVRVRIPAKIPAGRMWFAIVIAAARTCLSNRCF